ncbi:GyrI-like domain-containing protein [Marinomonas spartinae]|uniref:GyrI-like domain-containing protein n=1 Tax=Marinomonas spartinae TaxID=1792290 RepID=UPI0018F22216|nr:effector binding domain-containing protein [Marinomonas spartinae]MBJ7555047.1 effector binding domain-containing protein [Marinomonas spartinae]
MAYHIKDAIQVKGLKIKTTAHNEMTTLGKIGPLWDHFMTEILPQLEEDCQLYGVCHYRNSNTHNDLDFVLGAKVEDMDKQPIQTAHELTSITIEAGGFLSFAAMGEHRPSVMRAWQQAHQFFNEEGCLYARTYKTDYVHYIDTHMATLYVSAIKKTAE